MLLLLLRLTFKIKFIEISVLNYIFKQNEKSLLAHKKSSEAQLLRDTAVEEMAIVLNKKDIETKWGAFSFSSLFILDVAT